MHHLEPQAILQRLLCVCHAFLSTWGVIYNKWPLKCDACFFKCNITGCVRSRATLVWMWEKVAFEAEWGPIDSNGERPLSDNNSLLFVTRFPLAKTKILLPLQLPKDLPP